MVYCHVLFCTYLSKATCHVTSGKLTIHISCRGCTVTIFYLASFALFLNGSWSRAWYLSGVVFVWKFMEVINLELEIKGGIFFGYT